MRDGELHAISTVATTIRLRAWAKVPTINRTPVNDIIRSIFISLRKLQKVAEIATIPSQKSLRCEETVLPMNRIIDYN